MTFNEYLMTLNGMETIVWIDQLSQTTSMDGRFALVGRLEVCDDFVLVHNDISVVSTGVRISSIICVELDFSEEDEDEDEPGEDIYAKFERMYQYYKDK